MDNQHCRFCGRPLTHTFVDLGLSPLSNEYLKESDLKCGQFFYPLRVNVCDGCFLVQATEYQRPEQIFGEYRHFSSYSTSWLAHCKAYVDMIVRRLGLTQSSKVLEIACNDGYLLQYFIPYGIKTKGIEPAENVAQVAREKGIDVKCCFFGKETAYDIVAQEGTFDLIIGNNVLAHVPDINSFVAGMAATLSPSGTITMEFPHLMQLMQLSQFDTIYHEHFSYLSLGAVERIFRSHGLRIYDVEELPTHGGSLRIYAAHEACGQLLTANSVNELLQREDRFGLNDISVYGDFAQKAFQIKLDTLQALMQLKREGKRIAAFGAAAKGNTFLNYCGLKRDVIDFVADSNPHKQGLYLPGSMIPIVEPGLIQQEKPDYLLILPWNLTSEIVELTKYIQSWGGRHIVCIPKVRILS